MDPWKSQTDCLTSTKEGSAPCGNNFEDSFVDMKHKEKSIMDEPGPQKKLADTDKYLNKLYGRLARLQQAPSSKQLLSSLQSGRADQLERLLSAGGPPSEPDPLPAADAVTTGYLQRRLLPHTVPLSSDELLQLLHADQLQQQADHQQQQQVDHQEQHQADHQQQQVDHQEQHQADQQQQERPEEGCS